MARETRHEVPRRGRPVVFTPTRAQRRSEQREIPLTPAPKTAWQKFKRAAVG
jgi:hypothetical protein